MNLMQIISCLILAVLVTAFVPWAFTQGKTIVRGIAHNSMTFPRGRVNLKPAAVISTRFLLGKRGESASLVDICGASDLPICVIEDTATAGDVSLGTPLACRLLGAGEETCRVVASEAITIDSDVYTAANGKVQNEPGTAGTYWKVGKAHAAAAADGDAFAIVPCEPVKLVVIAALTSTDGVAAAASANLANLAAEAEKIGDDVRAIAAALATPALVKVLAS